MSIINGFVQNGLNHIFVEIKRFNTVILGFFIYLVSKSSIKLKILGTLSFILFWSISILNTNYNISGFSVKSISILLITCGVIFLEYIVKRISSPHFVVFLDEKQQKLFYIFFASLGCMIGNFTSAGLGYNGYFFGLIIGFIFQNVFLNIMFRFLNLNLSKDN